MSDKLPDHTPRTEGRLVDLEDHNVGGERRRSTDKWVIGCTLISLLCLICLFVVASTTTINSGRITKQQDRAYDADVGACDRINDLRRQTNRASVIIYFVLKAAAVGNAGSSDPAERKAAKQFDRYANLVTFLRQTDCEQAVANPLKYETPAAVPMDALDEGERVRVLIDGTY